MALQQAVGETICHKYCYIQGVHVAVAAGNSFVNEYKPSNMMEGSRDRSSSCNQLLSTWIQRQRPLLPFSALATTFHNPFSLEQHKQDTTASSGCSQLTWGMDSEDLFTKITNWLWDYDKCNRFRTTGYMGDLWEQSDDSALQSASIPPEWNYLPLSANLFIQF